MLDEEVFQALRALALNAGATETARAMALYGMIVQIRGPTLLDQPITTVLRAGQEPCQSRTYSGGVRAGTPLDSGAHGQMASATRTIFKNENESAAIRAAARCAYAFVRALVPADVSSLDLSYVCGPQFRVFHASWESAEGVTWTVDNVPVLGKLTVPPHTDVDFAAGAVGTVRIYYQGALMDAEANGNRPC